MEYVNLHWYACKCSGSEWVAKEQLESKKQFLHDVFGAYKFEELDDYGCLIKVSYK